MAADDNGQNGGDGPKIVDIRQARRRRSRRKETRQERRGPGPVRGPAQPGQQPERFKAFHQVGVAFKWLLVGFVVVALLQWLLGHLPDLLPVVNIDG